MKSLISDERECFVCGNPNVVIHHIYEGHGRRSKSDEDGCWCYLCAIHHNMSNEAVHMNRELDLKLKTLCQILWQEHYGKTTEEFIQRFGRSYT